MTEREYLKQRIQEGKDVIEKISEPDGGECADPGIRLGIESVRRRIAQHEARLADMDRQRTLRADNRIKKKGVGTRADS